MTTTHVPGRTGRVGGTRPSPASRTAPTAPRQAAFWLLALVLGVTMLGTVLSLFSIVRIGRIASPGEPS